MLEPLRWDTSSLADNDNNNNNNNNKRTSFSKILPDKQARGKNVLTRMFSTRRLFTWACRLPLLILWTILVILVLYILIDINQFGTVDSLEQPNISIDNHHLRRPKTIHRSTRNQQESTTRWSSAKQRRDSHEIAKQSPADEPLNRRPTVRAAHASTTRKSPTSGHARQGDIFILIVQEEDLRSKATILKSASKSQQTSTHTPYPSTSSSKSSRKQTHKISIPGHIEKLIEILDAHRIAYTLDTTRYGMPTSLLEVGNHLQQHRHSVIVIDDLIKYTKLNRWLRDQLDRYCRSNRVGVITYLLDNHKLDHQLLGMSKIYDGKHSSKYRGRSMTDNFPLTIEPVEQSCHNATSPKCLVDYQLNHQASMLRILKRREDFIVKGKLTTPGHAPIMTMFSNHVTYEPLTWARWRPVPKNEEGRNKRQTSTDYAGDGGTRNTNQKQIFIRPSHKRSLLLSKRAALTSHHEGVVDDTNDNMIQRDEANGKRREDDELAGRGGDDLPPLGIVEPELNVDQSFELADGESTNTPMVVETEDRLVLSMIDHGLYDGIRRVIFGRSNHHWLDRILLLDSIEHLSSGEIMSPLERYIQIDIDDIFVGERGTRLQKVDVEALIETQRHFASNLFEDDEFKFNLGFSGKYFKHGNEKEQLGDEYLLENANKFTWFCHFFSHAKAHLKNDSEAVAQELKKNLEFARDHSIQLIGHLKALDQYEPGKLPPTYAVAPHHSGVYPVHEQLYEAWRAILNVQVTSTEEYPHLRPASGRRGFVHNSIKVLPRQTCGLYTHTIYRNKYPGGIGKLLESIHGGELFETILHNPVNIYMTHMSNYANDRLAPYTFKALFEFVQKFTNLRLKYAPSNQVGATSLTNEDEDNDIIINRKQFAGTADGGTNANVDTDYPLDMDTGPLGPARLANYYFSLFPHESDPIWTNPCADKRHLAIWAPVKQQLCRVVPNCLIVGPQKTGTTALWSFMRLNPTFKTSFMSPEDFEEVQFFNDKHYWRGPDWYLSRFLTTTIMTNASKSEQRTESNYSSPMEADEGANETAGSEAKLAWWLSNEDEGEYYVDKSATYFDDSKAARRAAALVPDAFIIIMLIDPVDRAYSWYQHIRAHGDQVANELSFEQVIMFNGKDDDDDVNNNDDPSETTTYSRGRGRASPRAAAIKALRRRCLHPGYYSTHLSTWLEHFASRQIIIIDGQWFKYNPVAVMNRLQLLLRIRHRVDYADLLAYSHEKGFYCEQPHKRQQKKGPLKCLGSGKGRHYPAMSQEARAYLISHYAVHNRHLARLLYEIGQPLPTWLDQAINQLPMSSSSSSSSTHVKH